MRCDDERYLSWGELETMRRQGFEIGVNLQDRSTFRAYSVEGAKLALSRGQERLVAHTRGESPPLAFRWGESEPALVEHARMLGFSCALHVGGLGMNAVSGEPFALRRLIFDPQSHDDLRMFAADVSGLKRWWPRLARDDVVGG